MRRALPLAPALCLLLALGPACDGGPGSPGGGTDWCAQDDGPYPGVRGLFAALCDALQRCELGPRMGYAFQCRQECVASFEFGTSCGIAESENERDRWNRQLVERQVIYDLDRGATCIAWLHAADCATVTAMLQGGGIGGSADDNPAQPVECQGVIDVVDPDDPPPDGTVPEGGACEDSRACQEGLTCRPPPEGQATCPVCGPLPGAGEPCLEYQCGLQAWCDWTQDPPRCLARLPDGGACTSPEQCTHGRCWAGSCVTPLADGQPCTDGGECESNLCHLERCTSYREEGEACEADAVCTTGRCHHGACIRILQLGEACEDDAQCWDLCFRGLCDQAHQAGDPCDDVSDCYDPQYMHCYQGVCVPLHQLPEGAPCAVDGDCATNRCLDGACFSMLDNGAACTQPGECAQLVCDQGFCGLADGATCWGHEMCRSMRCLDRTTCVTPKADGAACLLSEECASWLCLEGACFTLGEVGAACVATVQCEDRLFCDADSASCQPQRGPGEACAGDDACRYGYCDPLALRCGLASGEACAHDTSCQGFCDGALCAERRADGEACARDAECVHYCERGTCRLDRPYGSECRADEECEGGLCTYAWSSMRCRAPGQCFENEQCDASQYCDDDDWPATCEARRADGEPCDRWEDQCEHFCYGSTCVARLPSGEECSADQDCIGGLCQDGRCTEPGLCHSDQDCAAGQVCSYSSYPYRCTDPRPDGSGCEEDRECASGWCSDFSEVCKTRPRLGEACGPYECPPEGYCLNGTCVARKRPGAACDASFTGDLECLAPSFCRFGVCEVMRLTCEPGPAGGQCTMLMVCEQGAYCDFLDGFTCKAQSAIGQRCESLMWANTCRPGSYCADGTCQAYAGEGQSCAGRACALTHRCDPATTTCRPLKYQGEPCEEDEECLGDSCEYFDTDDHRCGPPCRMP